MKTAVFSVLVALATLCAFAQTPPVITSIDPANGTVLGGTRVILHGEHLFGPCQVAECIPTILLFGGNPATEVTVVDDNTVTAVVPASWYAGVLYPGAFDVYFGNSLGHVNVPGAYTYHDERVLLPVLANNSPGGYGSIWRTRFTYHNSGTSAVLVQPTGVCHVPECPPYLELAAGGIGELAWNTDSSYVEIGRFFSINGGDPDSLWMRLVAEDTTRLSTTAGTEIPVVRESRFRQGSIRLIGVHASTLFRNRLRFYLDDEPEPVSVRSYAVPTEGSPHLAKEITVMPTRPDQKLTELSWADASAWFLSRAEVQLEDEMFPEPDEDYIIEVVPSTNVPLWAFVSVTNNQTAHITTITPQ